MMAILPQTSNRIVKKTYRRICFLHCSCALFSTILLPTSSFLRSSSALLLLPPLQQPSHHRVDSISGKTTWTKTKLWTSTSPKFSTWEIDEENIEESTEYIDVEEDQDEGNNADDSSSTVLFEEHRIWSKAVDDAIKTLKKKRNSLQSELAKAEGAESTAERAKLLVSNLYMFQGGVKSATVIDWENDDKEVELNLDTEKYSSASDEADALFSLVRKLKRGSKIVANLLEETAAAWDILREVESDLRSAMDERGEDVDEGRLALVKERLTRTLKTTKFQVPTADGINNSIKSINSSGQNKNRREKKPDLGTPASNVRKLTSPGGCIVLVGRNRRGNEHLSLSVARGNDIWMHSRGAPGAHVIIQNRRGGPTVTDECLQFGADLAIFYSDLRNENKAEVTAAEPKHIQKPRGAPLGAVKLREEWKTFVGRPDRVPSELKEAREGSGQTDEYHMSDKAKHRRRTKQVAEDDRIKRKQQQRERKSQK
ncbi:MAG: putative ribosome quality control (RQC) complex YloA/Tae2 family protein [Bacillariaceae sp.]|jgi:predicted ribosome quality control (RQC) complex YloA/Tae2 family protein